MSFAASRLPRFQRSAVFPPVFLTVRDHTILHQLNRHRFLRSHQIAALVGGSRQQVLRRLQALYHHGYLERPRCQIDYYHAGGSRSMVYGLGRRGAAYLRRVDELPFRQPDTSAESGTIKRLFLEHALMVSDCMVALELACRQRGDMRLLMEDEIPLPEATRNAREPFRWTVPVPGHGQFGVIPDRVFLLASRESSRGVLYFLEADRGTMPIRRPRLGASSFRRKLLAYAATWTQGVQRTRFATSRVRVLTVTTTAERVRHLLDACADLGAGRGLFLFADAATLHSTDDPLEMRWAQPGKQDAVPLLD